MSLSKNPVPKLATFLEGYGRRVQYAVFECFLSLAEMRTLHSALQKRVDLEEDDVRLYWIPAASVSQALTLGSEPPEPPPTVYII
ncbi:MAG: CRISPR-associated endonuclease Cas2 [Spirulinaceae cyanobacterium SM2_1_0]|nr:CRISPR-associated endonuclease Cas2 [Spirulinaceae cyanobacterium SM2_1_0]